VAAAEFTQERLEDIKRVDQEIKWHGSRIA
jgi:hypothetical protein